MNKPEAIKHIEGFINTVTLHKQQATSATQITLYTGMILGLKEALEIAEKMND